MYGSGYSCNEAMPDGIAGFETLPILGMCWRDITKNKHQTLVHFVIPTYFIGA